MRFGSAIYLTAPPNTESKCMIKEYVQETSDARYLLSVQDSAVLLFNLVRIQSLYLDTSIEIGLPTNVIAKWLVATYEKLDVIFIASWKLMLLILDYLHVDYKYHQILPFQILGSKLC